MTDLLADTYALFAVLDGSKAYRRRLAGKRVATTALNLVELVYGLERRGHGDQVQEVLPPFLELIVEPGPDVIVQSARFKRARLEAGGRCSYVDAWGYATAQALKVPFLTGDEAFRGVQGVAFLKA